MVSLLGHPKSALRGQHYSSLTATFVKIATNVVRYTLQQSQLPLSTYDVSLTVGQNAHQSLSLVCGVFQLENYVVYLVVDIA